MALDAVLPVVVANIAVYAGAAYYGTLNPDVVWGRGRDAPDWTAGALGGVTSLGAMGLVTADAGYDVVLLAFGLVSFGFLAGVAYGREDTA